jgi:hypothetical protein
MRLALAVTVKYSVSTSPFFHMRLHIDTMPSRGASFEGAGCKDRAISAYVSFAACPCFIDLCCVSLFNEIKCLIGSILLYVLVHLQIKIPVPCDINFRYPNAVYICNILDCVYDHIEPI